ncbi:MAG: OsmC family peroxiredoxin [Bacteroidales bacterium]|nr:OsmC family peroxiredoxin [Bacteroidales bacterium]
MKRTSKAHWSGTLKEGKGTLDTQSGTLNKTNYNFSARFEEGAKGTNPEELLAAAHAGCFTMWVASLLTQKGLTPANLDTVATITLENATITGIHLSIAGSVPGLNAEEFSAIVKEAEKDCIVSRALSVPITSEAHFVV